MSFPLTTGGGFDGAAGVAVSWIRRLMSKGKDRLTPAQVRLKIKK